MRKFLIKIGYFAIIFIIINFIFLALISLTDWNFKKRIEALRMEKPKFDLIVLGNSLAMDGIDTKLLTEKGLNSYNMAIGGANAETNYIMLEEYLDKCETKPQYVIFGVATYTNFD